MGLGRCSMKGPQGANPTRLVLGNPNTEWTELTKGSHKVKDSDDVQGALEVNVRFYEAFQTGRHDWMETLWATTTPVVCIHPGRPPIHGLAGILASWRSILESPPPIEVSHIQAEIIRGLALVTCMEQIEETQLAATNFFVWEGGQWKMAFHQSGISQAIQDGDFNPNGSLH